LKIATVTDEPAEAVTVINAHYAKKMAA